MSAVVNFTEDQRDCLQEVVNVAMGQAGDSLARFLEVFINLSVPQIRLVKSAQLKDALVELVGSDEKVSAVRQGFFSPTAKNFQGEAIVIFSDTSFSELAELLDYEEKPNDQIERELLLDVTNLLNGTCLTGIGEQIEIEIAFSRPSVIGQHISTQKVVDGENLVWDESLLVEIHYTLENRSLKCSLLMLMPEEGIAIVKSQLDRMLEGF